MKTRIGRWLTQLTARRGIALAVGPGLLTVALDSAIAHFAERSMRNPAQLAPVLFAPAALVALLAVAVPRIPFRAFRRVVRAVGAIGIAVGLAGTGFHLMALWRLLEGAPITRQALVAALAVAPPVFAPGAFAGIGIIVWLLGSPRLNVSFEARSNGDSGEGVLQAHAA
jgi:hypothetical protein